MSGHPFIERGSPVRVRKRALQKARKSGPLFSDRLAESRWWVGMESFVEPSGRETCRAIGGSPDCSSRYAGSSRGPQGGRGGSGCRHNPGRSHASATGCNSRRSSTCSIEQTLRPGAEQCGAAPWGAAPHPVCGLVHWANGPLRNCRTVIRLPPARTASMSTEEAPITAAPHSNPSSTVWGVKTSVLPANQVDPGV
jgi:hypothetical protein